MPNQPAAHELGPNGQCDECGQLHRTHRGAVACAGHVRFDRDPASPTYRARLDQPRPCGNDPRPGLDRCPRHGAGGKNATEASQRHQAERKALAKLGNVGEPITDPIGKLCAIAGRAVAFMEALAHRVDNLDAETASDQARAEIAVYGRSIKDAAGVVESIIRMGIAERLAKQDADRTGAWVAFIDGVLLELGHNPRDPKVAGVVLRMLESAA